MSTKYAVILQESVHHEGDERSRTHPGHGYPAYTETYDVIKKFKDEAELRKWIDYNHGKKQYTLIKYEEIPVTTEIKINF